MRARGEMASLGVRAIVFNSERRLILISTVWELT